ncbi:bile acid:sodium symporter, partial [Streptomyces flaveolus]|uniref:bile acid:sodium symporter n=1 Tax=Streptomyces flaveolus TaxID=67297 RepID=UPI0036FFA009
GLPMASVLFGAHASLAVLPLMLFHQMQLMVCAVIAKRRARDPEALTAWGNIGTAVGAVIDHGPGGPGSALSDSRGGAKYSS